MVKGAPFRDTGSMNHLTFTVADDAAFVQELLVGILQKHGATCLGVASNGHQAVAQALELKPQLIIMDIVMPQLNGIEASKNILAVHECLIVACTGLMNQELKNQALNVGCKAFLAKPFTEQSTLEIVRTHYKVPATG